MRRSKLTATLLLTLTGTAGAQHVRGTVSVAAGTETDAVGVASRALTASPSLAILVDPRLLLAVEASGTRYDNHQWAISAGAAGAGRVALNRWAALTLNSGVSTTGTSFGFSYASANALPALEMTAGRVTAYGGIRGAVASTQTSTQSTFVGQPSQGPFGNTPFPPTAGTMVSRTSRSARCGVFGANVRVAGGEGSSLLAGVRDEQGMTDTVTTADRSASLSVVNGRLTIAGSIGLHSEVGNHSTFASGTAGVALIPGATLEFSAGSYPTNHLIGTPRGHFLTIGMSLRGARGVRASTRPAAVEGVPVPALGFTRLVLRDDKARRVDVAGDFSNWNVIATQRAGHGVWFVDLRIPPGQYRYAFRVNGIAWRVPDGVAAVSDDFGGQSAWLTVSDTPSRSVR